MLIEHSVKGIGLECSFPHKIKTFKGVLVFDRKVSHEGSGNAA